MVLVCLILSVLSTIPLYEGFGNGPLFYMVRKQSHPPPCDPPPQCVKESPQVWCMFGFRRLYWSCFSGWSMSFGSGQPDVAVSTWVFAVDSTLQENQSQSLVSYHYYMQQSSLMLLLGYPRVIVWRHGVKGGFLLADCVVVIASIFALTLGSNGKVFATSAIR